MSTAPANFYDLTRDDLRQLATRWDFSPVHAARLWAYVYVDRVEDWARMTELPPRFRDRAETELVFGRLPVAVETHSRDGFTRKYLLGLGDDRRIETVLMRYTGRVTAWLRHGLRVLCDRADGLCASPHRRRNRGAGHACG